jgi:LysM repeat protein
LQYIQADCKETKEWKKDMAFRYLNKTGIVLMLAVSFLTLASYGQKNTRAEYIATWKETAQQSMRALGIPASITLAQACLESADGNSDLAVRGKNHFGIKCHGWDGKKIYHDDDKKHECFRKYKKAEQSFEDHAAFLSERSRYAFLFELDTDDYKGWARGLKKAGYATNPKYPALLIKIIEDNNLAVIDADVMAEGKRNRRKDRKEEKEQEEIVAEDVPIKKISKEVIKEDIKEEIADEEPEAQLLEKPKPVKEEKPKKSVEFGETIEVNVGKILMVHPNNVKFVLASAGDTPASIAEELNLGTWQIEKYNDVDKNWQFVDEAVVFIQPKRNKAKDPMHRVSDGETLWDISQQHAISLSKLMEYNRLTSRSSIQAGDQLFLRKP